MGEVRAVRDQACQWGADTKANTRGGGALELGDSRLFEDGSERGGAIVSDLVDADTAQHGCEVGAVRG